MKPATLYTLAILAGLALGFLSLRAGEALADEGSGSGSAVTPAPHDTVDDPTKDPGAYIDDVKAAKRQGWPLAILVGAYGVMIGLIRLGWLKKVSGTAAAVLAAGAAIVASALDALVSTGTWWATMAAAVGALLLVLAPHKTEAAT